MILNQIIESIYCKWLYGWIYNYERWKKEWKMRRQSRLKKRSCIRRRKDEKTIEIDTGSFWEAYWLHCINMISYWLIFKTDVDTLSTHFIPFLFIVWLYDTPYRNPELGSDYSPTTKAKSSWLHSYTGPINIFSNNRLYNSDHMKLALISIILPLEKFMKVT